MVLHIVCIVLWTLIGIMVFTRNEVTKIDYFFAWIVLMIQLISNLVEVI